MSLTTTILLLYGACLAGAIASRPAPGPIEGAPTETRRPGRPPTALLLPFLALFALAAPMGVARAGEAAPIAGPATVIDGATLSVDGVRLRLHGIEAPGLDQTCFDGRERGYPCGRVAAAALAARIGGQSLACEPRAEDRGTARCRLGADDLAAWLVERGYAVADRRVSTEYLAQDERAWGRRAGLWSGVFDLPTQRPGLRGATAGL
ncbi:thermonuclease family protein [Methylobacterium sp. Leaf118]|uniref:thermonuclease family protein n=1 Tax=Methylobacterium sp. Leaf118 TaxID=2876562 RepID=UPI001E3C2649|nr:thermonuclease family protein [Methylobacterium sp. Leaf118]